MMRKVTVYASRTSWFFVPMNGVILTIGTSWGLSRPVSVLPAASTPVEKGSEGLRALEASRDQLTPEEEFQEGLVAAPDPAEWYTRPWKGPADCILGLAGVKTWTGFYREALSCELIKDAGNLRIVPYTKYRSGRKGYGVLDEKTIVLPEDATAQEIGAALEKAFAISVSS